MNFFCLSPSEKKWKYHIDWIYPNDLRTRGQMSELFDMLHVKSWFKDLKAEMCIDHEVGTTITITLRLTLV